ncbi:MAG: glycoside hydrolase family 9 protein [Fibrobacter sp.]|nr:glycoside hydrolase family 9 protein [Fibrobacter sp.]
MRLAFFIPFLAVGLYAADTPFDLIRPVYPLEWDTSAAEDGGTVYDFANFSVNEEDTEVGTPESGAKPADFKANAYIADTLNQAFIDALSLKVGNIRVNQAGYLPDDPEKQFYYVSDKCEKATYSVVDLDGNEVAADGKFTATGDSAKSVRTVKAYVNSLLNRYTVERSTPKTKVCAGKLADMASLPTDKRLRIKVGKEYSSTFIVSDKVYSMVRDANLKFFGVERSGNSESWFHGPSHVHDTIPGGWYDCGDNLKMAPTMGYTFLVLSLLSATNPERDEDHYAFNHNEIVKTDGIPDMLREARHGAEFYLTSYRHAKGDIKDMIVNVGDVDDHNYWNRADSMESMNPAPPRPVIHGIGPGMSAQVAAGLALLSVRYAAYDSTFADSCLYVAEKLYAYAKEHFGEEEFCLGGFYSCTIGSKHVDVLAMAAIALHYATYEKTKKMDYLNDAAEDKTINSNKSAEYNYEYFPAGWLGVGSGFTQGAWPSGYQERFSITLYAFYKLLLADSATAEKYGIEDSVRLDYVQRVAYSLARNAELGTKTTSFPEANSIKLLGNFSLVYPTPWYLTVDFEWGANRDDSGNILNMLTFAEVAKDIDAKKTITGSAGWNYVGARQLAINKMNYILGVNQWDLSFMVGVGDKNESHVHHRTANPEGWNIYDRETMKDLPVNYSYRPPVGALLDGSSNDALVSDWVNFLATETAISGNASFLVANVLLAADPAVLSADTSKKDTTKTDSTKTDSTQVDKKDSTKADSTKKDAIPGVPLAGASHLGIVNHGDVLDVNYVLPVAQEVRVSLVSIKGKTMKLYTPGQQSAGRHALRWNVEKVPAGVYLVEYRAGSAREYRTVRIGR